MSCQLSKCSPSTVFGTMEEKRSCDFEAGGFYEDQAGMENVMGMTNAGFMQRMARHKNKEGKFSTKGVSYVFPLHHDMADIVTGNLPPNTEIVLELHISSNEFAIMSLNGGVSFLHWNQTL